ncbi:MAG TPA: zinc-finger domain-containing protein [Chromatiaceae bacterium]|jgi:uncharacterized Zn-finger protein|nr:zinc-finger domain-containing protein [Chromatiaceae bacterium]
MTAKIYQPKNPIPVTGDTVACSKKTYEVREEDLPLHCPMDGMTLWDSHPRVYLPVEDTGKVACPYCGANYILKS